MRYLSLFSGMGGIDLALDRAGMQCVAQCELDPHATAVLARHWPDVPRFPDVRTMKGQDVGTVDLVAGGFPCQDLSVAGKRAGLAGERSGLFWEFIRIIDECAPRWVLFENVPGLLSSNKGRDMAAVVGALAERGYGWAYRILDSQYFGVAQPRRRVFIVGCLGDAARAVSVLFESESCKRHPAPRRAPREGVAGTLGGGAGSRGWASDTDRMTFVPEVATAVTAKAAKRTGGPAGDEAQNLVAYGIRAAHTSSNGWGVQEEQSHTLDGASPHYVAFQQNVSDEVRLISGDGQIAGALLADPGPDERNYVAAFTERTRKDGRNLEVQEELAYTLTNPGSGGRTHSRQLVQGMTVRRLTPVECLRLQGFPDDWFDGLNLADSAKYRLCGNAVAVPVVEWIGRRIIAAH